MRVINVVVIKEGIVNDITSFEVFDKDCSDEEIDVAEQMYLDSVKTAENYYTEKCIEWGAEETDMDIYIEEGYYAGGNFSVCLTWSEI